VLVSDDAAGDTDTVLFGGARRARKLMADILERFVRRDTACELEV
jgi:hypothetical protein